MKTLLMFLLLTFVFYVIHRLLHSFRCLSYFHRDHHLNVSNNSVRWRWNNLLLWNDTFKSTVDLWITEVIPTMLICWVFDSWTLLFLYWAWGAIVQEAVEHNKLFNLPILTSGVWHMIHHSDSRVNYGVFIPVWDMLFRTHCAKTSNC